MFDCLDIPLPTVKTAFVAHSNNSWLYNVLSQIPTHIQRSNTATHFIMFVKVLLYTVTPTLPNKHPGVTHAAFKMNGGGCVCMNDEMLKWNNYEPGP